MTTRQRGGTSSRTAVENSLNNAINKAFQTGNDYSPETILEVYNQLYESKNGSPQGNVVPQLFNSTAPVRISYSYIWRKSSDIPWGDHFHATFVIGVAAQDGQPVFIEFSHAVQYIFIKQHPKPVNTENQKITCVTDEKTNKTVGDLVKLALYHWYAVNQVKSLFQWPTSCTGFTDLLMYYTYYQTFDILSNCPLTIQKKIRGNRTRVHHIYQDPMIPVDPGTSTRIARVYARESKPTLGFSARKSRSRKSVKRKSRKRTCKYGMKKSGDCKKKPGRKSRSKRSSKSRRKSVRKSRRRRSGVKRKSKKRTCKYGIKKSGDCKKKHGRKSRSTKSRRKSVLKSRRRRSVQRKSKKRTCKYGIKKSGDCKKKHGRKSRSTKSRRKSVRKSRR
jgi:hypothetical protein